MLHRHSPFYSAWWELVTGCSPVSRGCSKCFARKESEQLQQMGIPRYQNGFKFTLHEAEIERIHKFIEKVKKPCLFSISPLSDLFQLKVPDDFILEVFRIMRRYIWCHFKIITKNSKRLMELSYQLPKGISNNVLLGVSVESPDQYYRIEDLKNTFMPNGGRKGISIAPLLSSMPNLPLEGMCQVFCTDERGDNAMPVKMEWIYDIKRQVKEAMMLYISPIIFGSNVGKPLSEPTHYYRWAMVTNLLESTLGMMAVFGLSHPRWKEYHKLYSYYRHLPFPYDELREKVRQVAPEFFEG